MNHLFEQAKAGEFALLQSEAKMMTAEQFADKHDSTVRRGHQLCVHVNGCDYFWSSKTGKFDGWGRGVLQSGGESA